MRNEDPMNSGLNFSLAWVRLLTEGASYSRAAVIDFRSIPDSVIHKNLSTEDRFPKSALQVVNIWLSKKLPCCSIEPRQGRLLPWFCPRNELVRPTCNRGHTHLIQFTYACGYYSRGGYYLFHWAPGVATIWGAASIRINMVLTSMRRQCIYMHLYICIKLT